MRKGIILFFAALYLIAISAFIFYPKPVVQETVVTEISEPVNIPETEPEPEIEPEPTVEVNPWSDEDIEVLAKMLWGETRGVQSKTEQAACVWCVLNRVDMSGCGIYAVTAAHNQFVGYYGENPVDDDLKALCKDVVSRWYAEKNGEEDVGRVLPAEYIYFTGDGKRNYFRCEYTGGEVWDWSLVTPYES